MHLQVAQNIPRYKRQNDVHDTRIDTTNYVELQSNGGIDTPTRLREDPVLVDRDLRRVQMYAVST